MGMNWNLKDQFAVRVVLPALFDDTSTRSHALSGPVRRPQDARAHLDTITYKKGKFLFKMCLKLFSPQSLFHGLVEFFYLKARL